jgi:hypothetical protein
MAKALVKLLGVVVVGAVIAAVVYVVKRPSAKESSGPLSYDQWPDVPRNPDASTPH